MVFFQRNALHDGQVSQELKRFAWASDRLLRKIQGLHRQDLLKIRIIMMIRMCSRLSLPDWRLSMAAGTSHYIRPRMITHRNSARVFYVMGLKLLQTLVPRECF